MKKKGTFGYIKSQRIIELIKSVFMIALCAGTYYIGVFSTGSNQNILTFVSILGCLPMAKFFVNFILFTKAKGCSESLHDKLQAENIEPTFYDLYFTAFKNSYQVSAIYYNKGNLIGISEDNSIDTEACEKHLEEILEKCGYKNITIKIFKDTVKYIDRHKQLTELEDDKDNSFLLENILGVSI